MILHKRLKYLVAYVCLLWAVLTSINIYKAFHIDDTFHLEAAECIRNHLQKPMSGNINWGDSPSPMYEHNQPPLFFYLISVSQEFFGNSEIALHLILSIFTFAALFFFYKLTKLLNTNSPFLVLTLFAFCPAFIVNQNLMTDVPILAFATGIMYFLLKGQKNNCIKYYIFSSILLSIGLLIKYSLIPLFLVILITILTTKNYKQSVVLFIPLITLIIWSLWNFLEFGSIHIISRPKSELSTEKILAFVSSLGAISIFSVVYLYNLFPYNLTRFLIVLSFVLFSVHVPIVYFDLIEEIKFNQFLNCLFFSNGLILICLAGNQVIKSVIKEKYNYLKTPFFSIAIYIIGFSAFIILFAPFNATRHILLLIPFILLLGKDQFEKTSGLINNTVIAASIVLGLLLGISDWFYADFYRKESENIKLANSKFWSLGHWGWQWYSKKAGMLIYSAKNEISVRNGDFIVFPKDVRKQNLSKDIHLDTIRFITKTPTFLTFFSGKNGASMYSSFINKPSWELSKIPIDTIFICKVKKEIGFKDIVERIKANEKWLNEVINKSRKRNLPIDSMLVKDAKWIISQNRKN